MADWRTLPLSDTPLTSNSTTPVTIDPHVVIQQIHGMLVGTDYLWAESTLRGMLTTIQKTGRVTERQATAVTNIADRPYRGTSRDRTRSGW